MNIFESVFLWWVFHHSLCFMKIHSRKFVKSLLILFACGWCSDSILAMCLDILCVYLWFCWNNFFLGNMFLKFIYCSQTNFKLELDSSCNDHFSFTNSNSIMLEHEPNISQSGVGFINHWLFPLFVYIVATT
jgi:hypothetical protein